MQEQVVYNTWEEGDLVTAHLRNIALIFDAGRLKLRVLSKELFDETHRDKGSAIGKS